MFMNGLLSYRGLQYGENQRKTDNFCLGRKIKHRRYFSIDFVASHGRWSCICRILSQLTDVHYSFSDVPQILCYVHHDHWKLLYFHLWRLKICACVECSNSNGRSKYLRYFSFVISGENGALDLQQRFEVCFKVIFTKLHLPFLCSLFWYFVNLW